MSLRPGQFLCLAAVVYVLLDIPLLASFGGLANNAFIVLGG